MNNSPFIVNLSKYTSPEVKELKYGNKDWVEYSGDSNYKNDYFQYLIDRMVGSTTNGAIITGISRMIYGKGLSALDASRKPDQYAQMLSIVKPKDLNKAVCDRKLFGMCALQVTKKGGKVSQVTHFPMETLRPQIADEEGNIKNWYYHPDWAKIKPSDQPDKIPAFGYGKPTGNEIYIVKPYVSGYHYFSPPDYAGCLPYAVIEEEIGDYQINDVMNSFSGTKIINFNNGSGDEEGREKIKKDVISKITGATGQRVIIAFNDNVENKATVEDVTLTDAPSHYEYLSNECFKKLIVGHRVTSPMLLGIREGQNGLGNNADEIQTATLLMDNLTIKPFQMEFIEALNEILSVNDISLKLYFKTLEPLEFIDTDGMDEETKKEETGVETALSEQGKMDLSDEDGELILQNLNGEVNNDEWELVDTRCYGESDESEEDWANRLIKPKRSLFSKIIKSKPSDASKLDKNIYKVRYSYQEKYSSEKTRAFCSAMMQRTSKGVVYRKEDIDQASFQGVNSEFGHKGENYSLFKFKGGVNCGHYWQEELYRLKKKTDGTFVEDKALSSSDEVDKIPKSYTPKGKDFDIAKVAPKDMDSSGHHPNYR